MTIALECDVCGKKYKLSDTLAGKTFVCKDCGLTLDVPGGRRTRGDEEEVIDRKPPKSSATIRSTGGGKRRSRRSQKDQLTMLAVAGGVVLAAIVLGAVFSGGANQGPSLAPPVNSGVVVEPTVASNATQNATQPVVPPAGTSTGTSTPPSATQSPAAPSTTTNVAAVARPESKDSTATPTGVADDSSAAARPTASSQGVFTLTVAPGWQVQVDPPAEPLPTAWATDWSLPVTGSFLTEACISFPATYSPFVILGTNEDAKAGREVWNLATGEKVHTFKGQRVNTTQPVALSPDGQMLAWFDFRSVTVYDLAGKKLLGELPSGSGDDTFNIARLDLPTSQRLVAMSFVDRGLKVWSLPDGNLRHATRVGDKFSYPAKSAYSPGGKYVALEAHFLDHTIQVHEVDTGEVVGTITAQKIGNAYGDLHGLAFSPDGSQLAAVFESTAGEGITQVAIWNVAEGTQAANHVTVPGIMHRVKNVRETAGVQWYADGKKLLVHGVTILDAATGAGLYEMQKPEPSFAASRRVFGTNGIADLSGTRQELQLRPIVISDADLGVSAKVAAAGGLPVDVKLPPLTKAELTASPDTVRAASWNFPAITAATVPAVVEEALPLKTGSGTLRQLSLAVQDQPRAFLRFAQGEDSTALPPQTTFRVDSQGRLQSRSRPRPVKAKTNWIDVYDLAAKQFLAKIDLPFSGDLVGCSPDGRRLLVQPHDAQGRLDVFDVADGRPVVGFRPYQSQPEERDWELSAAAMLDADHVATLNDDDLFVVWELPACRSVYAVDQALTFSVSPGGGQIAVATDTGVDLRDALTGTALGFVPFKGSIRGLVFHPQGDRLAVLLSDQGGAYIYTVDLKDGQIGNEIPSPVTGTLVWGSDRYLLVEVARGDWRLLDLEAKTVAWTYLLKDGVVAANHPDARFWYAVPKSPRVPALNLVAVTLPDESVAKRLSAQELAPELLLQPGDKVTVRARVTPLTNRPQLENEVLALIHKAVERSGVTAANGQPVELNVTATAKAGRSVSVRKLGTEETTSVQEISLEILLAYKRGQETLWQDRFAATNTTGFIIKRIAEGESVQAAFDKDLWDRMNRYGESLQLPVYLFAPKSVEGLGKTTLSAILK
uniref:WD40 repeat domain-containing protein n=1 Tax=Schlesneria paludicola TaxID=360056 RepID=A0A7C2JY06_9PLAN